ncbi:MAG: thioesterase [Deltaproteobacteria bacterium]|nr:thioesterase [Deltaproteobacteria bacterium]
MSDKPYQTQLIFFPFAGASFYSFNPLINSIPEDRINVRVLELPGRGKRIKEPLISDVETMAQDFFVLIKDTLSIPFAFFGHSLGAVLAYEVILKLIDSGADLPCRLFVSGRGGPRVPPRNPRIANLPKNEFFEELKIFDGTPAQMFEEKDLMDFLEPMLRADFAAAGSYAPEQIRRIPLPVTAFNGEGDTVSREDALAWQDVTDIPLTLKEFHGNHFFIFDHGEKLWSAMSTALKLSLDGNSLS